MYLNRVGIPAPETIDGRLSPMRGAVVGYPKDPIRGSVRLLLHDEIDQLAVTIDTRGVFAQAKYFGPAHIPRSHVSQRPHSFIFKFNPSTTASGWSGRALQPTASLNARFFIGRDNKIIVAQGVAFPKPMVQIKDSRGFWFEIRVTGPNPTPVTPRPNSVLAQPAPDRFSADGRDDSLFFRVPGNLVVSKFGKRKPEVLGQLAGKRLNGNQDFRGGKAPGLPRRGISWRPARRWSKKRFRHLETICRGKSRRLPICLFEKPSDARRIILARMTSQYDDVYFRAVSCNCFFSSADSKTLYGLFRGIITSNLESDYAIFQ